MKYTRLCVLAPLVLLCACDAEPIQPNAIQPQFAKKIINEKFELETDFFVEQENPCLPGEFVTLQGTVLEQHHVWLDVNGTSMDKVTLTPIDVKGRGSPSGAKYWASGTETHSVKVKADNSVKDKLDSRFKATGTGPNDDFTIIVKFYVKVDAEGNVRVVRDKAVLKCEKSKKGDRD